jgi:hypothetical protein
VRLPAPGEERPAEIVTGERHNLVVNGSPDDAVMSDLFGLETPLAARATQLRADVRRVERKIALNRASKRDYEQLNILRGLLPQTASTDVAAALERLAADLDA